MAFITKKQSYARRLTGAPFGDMLAISDFNLTTNASGVAALSDTATAVAANDIVRLGILPAGLKLLDYIGTISDAFTATTTFDLGFSYVDGVDSTDVPQNAAYFASGASLATAAVLRKATTTAPLTLPKDAYLILTNKTAAQSAAGVIDIAVIGQAVGAP